MTLTAVECWNTPSSQGREKTIPSEEYEIDLELRLGSHTARLPPMLISENAPDLESSPGSRVTSSAAIVLYENDDQTEVGKKQGMEWNHPGPSLTLKPFLQSNEGDRATPIFKDVVQLHFIIGLEKEARISQLLASIHLIGNSVLIALESF